MFRPLRRMLCAPACAGLLVALLSAGCGQRIAPGSPPVMPDDLRARSEVPSPRAAACVNCHTQAVARWRGSQHASANRLVSPALDSVAFAKRFVYAEGAYTTTVARSAGTPNIFWAEPHANPVRHVPEAVIGVSPLVQYLIPFPGGRLQVLNLAFDPRSNEWFNSQGDGRTPADWGHWVNRGLNWNSQCAYCHMTGFQKQYDQNTDSYQSTWLESGIGCVQCHGDLTVHASRGGPVVPEQRIPTNRMIAVCASCHSRREELTGTFKPGEVYNDHFRLALADQAHIYYPDGQVHDEDFEFGSFSMSRMQHMGVTCLDCHDPHSGRLRVPADNNTLCLGCHAPPGQRGAKVVDPATHSHHAAGTPGDRCIDCHMPVNVYMGRDGRRDHLFGVPDPQMNKEAGIPDACTRCHQDKGVDWNIEWVEKWYGAKMDRIQRYRARALTRLRRGELEAVGEVMRLSRAEEIPAWRAALVASLAPWVERSEVHGYLSEALADPDPLVRSAAVIGLANGPDAYAMLKTLRRDPSRLVRIDAARATVNPLEYQQPSHGELVEYLRNSSDQPAGALRQSEKAMAEDKVEAARRWAEKAVAWDRSSAAAHAWLGRILTLSGSSEEAEEVLVEACRLEPEEPTHAYTLALLYGQTGRPADAAKYLQRATTLDPAFGRAWYNLGLALAQLNDLSGALDALRKAERIMPDSVDPPYARATIHLRRGEKDQAREAAQRCATLDSKHAPTQELLRRLN